ncbi:hypothetical protein SAMN04489712_11092 [Thermomonospora echinospora]|uniref:DUF8083 domain-containing protein n=1 Tax=Thermomonospora echinospora TaxID=1992 RepID=A0A1H6CJZ0_9ACTN|nr:hypothetical protein [Thermomonospora echinospora]SEG73284.1 hypothetical protein SAMN04489712_11092 [Thermomonospora echinospora]
MLPYAAYLRIYEPVTAFPEPLRSVWTAYAESGRRSGRAQALVAEHGEAVRRLASAVVAPEAESSHAYVRRAGGMLYICPWETRLRSWLAFARFRDGLPPGLSGAFLPEQRARQASAEFERWKASGRTLHPHILSSTWHVPLSWFVPFDPAERRLLLGDDDAELAGGTGGHGGDVRHERSVTDGHGSGDGPEGGWPGGLSGLSGPETGAAGLPGGAAPSGKPQGPVGPRGPAGTWIAGSGDVPAEGGGSPGPTRAAATRTLVYVTAMPEARRRLERARRLADGLPGGALEPGHLDTVARWLAEFHPSALVELDYGGLVHLVDDERLRADESVREMAVALAAMERGEPELTLAMHRRLGARWRSVRALESAN